MTENLSNILASVVINSDLTMNIFLKGNEVPQSKISHLSSGSIRSVSELCNILSLVKSWCMEENDADLTVILSEQVMEIINQLIEKDYNPELFCFMREQIHLLSSEVNARRYSSELLINAFLWHVTSPSLYEV